MADIPHDTRAVVACHGENGALGHPKVYLELDAKGKAVCPYCSKQLTQDDLVDK